MGTYKMCLTANHLSKQATKHICFDLFQFCRQRELDRHTDGYVHLETGWVTKVNVLWPSPIVEVPVNKTDLIWSSYKNDETSRINGQTYGPF